MSRYMNWETLIAERNDWVAKNFPPVEGDIPGRDSILGCIEELGELAHAHLKRKQGIRGTPEEHDDAARDAIGDMMVYLLGVANAHIDPKTMCLRVDKVGLTDEEYLLWLANAISLMVIYDLMGRSKQTWSQAIGHVIYYAAAYARAHDWNFEDIVHETWDYVKQRDWQRHRADGAPRDDPKMKDPSSHTAGLTNAVTEHAPGEFEMHGGDASVFE